MKEVNWTDFKELVRKNGVQTVTEGPCLKVNYYGEYQFYVVVHPEQLMKDKVESTCSLIDASRGR